jgi:hypothetical protein
LDIFNLTGKKVFERILDRPAGELEQYQFNLVSGMYILNLYSGSQQISGKLIVR